MSDEKDSRKPQQPLREFVLWWMVNVSASFFLSGAHNVFYFASDIQTPVIHWMHYMATAAFLFLFRSLGLFPKQPLYPWKEFLLPVGAKLVETFVSSLVHAQNRTGELYLIRIFDFITTLVIVNFGQKWIGTANERPANHHLLWLGGAASLSWLEFGQLEYTFVSLVFAPILPIIRALSILALWRCSQKLQIDSMDGFLMQYTALVSLVLAIPAYYSYANRIVEVTASWESIDMILMRFSPIFMASAVYSESWFLLCAGGPRSLLVAENSKFFMASLGQWIIQNMAHPSILALIGKMIFLASGLRMISNQFQSK